MSAFNMSWIPDERPKRWFVQYGARTFYGRGFRSKASVDRWITGILGIDWRVGFRFRMKGDDRDVWIVDRQGTEARP